ncbi:MAG: hypothetical protein ACJAS1_005405 [Oleiphilaceae bacterium]|jgi:hypothetical protein
MGQDQYSMTFKRFIQTIILSSRPSSIFVAGMVPSIWKIPLDINLQLLECESEVGIIINKHKKLPLKHAEHLAADNYDALVALLDDLDNNDEIYSWVFGLGFRYFRKHNET